MERRALKRRTLELVLVFFRRGGGEEDALRTGWRAALTSWRVRAVQGYECSSSLRTADLGRKLVQNCARARVRCPLSP
jgi:hypothetical protein